MIYYWLSWLRIRDEFGSRETSPGFQLALPNFVNCLLLLPKFKKTTSTLQCLLRLPLRRYACVPSEDCACVAGEKPGLCVPWFHICSSCCVLLSRSTYYVPWFHVYLRSSHIISLCSKFISLPDVLLFVLQLCCVILIVFVLFNHTLLTILVY